MKSTLSKTAFTLIELIVSSLLVAVVTLGIFSINNVLNNNNVDYGQRALVRSETQTTLNHILNNAALGKGTGIASDEGIIIGGGLMDGDLNSFCIHQGGGAGNNLINNANDIWLCYTLSNNQIDWCVETYPAGDVTTPGSVADPRSASSCTAAIAGTGGTIIQYPAGTNETFLGSANSITQTVGTTLPSSPYFVNINTPSQLLFSINILNCLNNSATSCNTNGTNYGISSDPTDNPEVQISGSVIPLEEST